MCIFDSILYRMYSCHSTLPISTALHHQCFLHACIRIIFAIILSMARLTSCLALDMLMDLQLEAFANPNMSMSNLNMSFECKFGSQ